MKTHEQFISEISKINDNIIVIGKYIKSTEYILVKCKKCGHEWKTKPYSLLSGKSCPVCGSKHSILNNTGKTHLKTQKEFEEQLKCINKDIKVIGKYNNTHSDIKCMCTYCGNIWNAKPYSLLQGHGCPRCAKSGTSFMEQFIRFSFNRALGEQEVLSRDRKTIGMELDIFIPSKRIAIEPGNWFLHKKIIERDKLKRNRCRDKGIKLITIYDKFPINETVPFENDCIVFNDDYNKADHSEIKKLVLKLFEITNIKKTFIIDEWNIIENLAYDNARANNHDDFINRMSTINPTIKILEKYKNANKRIKVKCNVCGNEWNAVPANLLSGDGCKKCGVKLAHQNVIKDQKDFVDEVKKANPDIEIIGTYTSRHNTVKAKCKICGQIWEPIASSLLRGSNHKGWKTIHKKLKDNVK